MRHSSKFGMLVRDPKGFTYTKKSTVFTKSITKCQTMTQSTNANYPLSLFLPREYICQMANRIAARRDV